ncbi:hypothetical protein ACSNOJ_31770, partial [Streptomyces sp. URMC 128]|uniref:hypothetical protein n=1 Tax=Streptomyces sp. URMC 128 TaxID=3423404 RepID=UPI003F1AA700
MDGCDSCPPTPFSCRRQDSGGPGSGFGTGSGPGGIGELTNIGILLAFVVVCAAVIVLRYRQP